MKTKIGHLKMATCRVIGLGVLLVATACGGSQGTIPATEASSVLRSKSFSEAVGRRLTDGEIDSYIDVSIVGRDRQIAFSLMKQMPKEKRGDVIDYDANGNIISNRIELRNEALDALYARPLLSHGRSGVLENRVSRSSLRLKADVSDYTNACSPPNPGPQPSGPYVRFLSKCSFTGAIGYVSVVCGSTSFGATEGGTLYFELRGRSGSLTEAGLQYNNDYSIQPYHRSTTTGYDTGQYINLPQHYTCGQTMGIMSGVLPDGSRTFTGIGLPDKSPSVYYLSPNAALWHHSVWAFFAPPNDVFEPGTDAGGFATPCSECSISRMTSIAQNGGYNKGSPAYFGFVNYGASQPQYGIHWEQVEMGQLIQPCTVSQTQALCTLEFFTNPNVWGGGFQRFPDRYVSQSYAPATSADPYETYDLINMRLIGTTSMVVSVQSFQ